jgi:predicted nucleotidyltransferase
LETNILDKYKRVLDFYNSTFIFQKSIIIEEILKEVKPVSIYLIGSFGREEGSFYLSNGNLSPLRDYDVLIVVDKYVRRDVINKIRRNIHNRLGLPDPFSRDFKFKGFTVWITQATLSDINALPLLKFYELKEASTLLWGKDIRESINLKFEDVSAYNGILILFSKIEGLLGLVEMNSLQKNELDVVDLIYECVKTYVEFGTCLSILIKKYEPSFVKRCAKISENFSALFPDLMEINDILPSLMLQYAVQRLLIDNEFLERVDVGRLLTQTVKDLKVMIWYYLRKAYNINLTFSGMSNCTIDDLSRNFGAHVLEDMFAYYVKRKLGFSSKIIVKPAVRMYLRYCLLKFFIASRKKGYKVRWGVLFASNANVMMKLWLIGLMLLESIDEDFNVDKDKLHKAENELQKMVDFGYMRARDSKYDAFSRFSFLRRTVLDLVDMADRIFHRKD